MKQPRSPHARYAFGYTDKKPTRTDNLVLVAVWCFAIYLLLGGTI